MIQEYLSKSTGLLDFELYHNDSLLGHLKYEKWFSWDATILIPNEEKYHVQSKGFWIPKLIVLQNAATIGTMQLKWNRIDITWNIEGVEYTFILRHSGFFQYKFTLTDSNENIFITLKSNYSWEKFRLDYDIKVMNNLPESLNKELFILSCMHGANYYLKMMAAIH